MNNRRNKTPRLRRVDDDFVVIYTRYITINGRRIYASDYGLRAFRLVIPRSKLR